MQCAFFLAAFAPDRFVQRLWLWSVSTRHIGSNRHDQEPDMTDKTRYVCQRERRGLPSQHTKYKTNEVGDFKLTHTPTVVQG